MKGRLNSEREDPLLRVRIGGGVCVIGGYKRGGEGGYKLTNLGAKGGRALPRRILVKMVAAFSEPAGA
jgi:hypothetical protein